MRKVSLKKPLFRVFCRFVMFIFFGTIIGKRCAKKRGKTYFCSNTQSYAIQVFKQDIQTEEF
jgi:hypothetical protein